MELTYLYFCRQCQDEFVKTFGTFSLVRHGTRQNACCPDCGKAASPDSFYDDREAKDGRPEGWKSL